MCIYIYILLWVLQLCFFSSFEANLGECKPKPGNEVSIRLPSGQRITRRFRPADPLEQMARFKVAQCCTYFAATLHIPVALSTFLIAFFRCCHFWLLSLWSQLPWWRSLPIWWISPLRWHKNVNVNHSTHCVVFFKANVDNFWQKLHLNRWPVSEALLAGHRGWHCNSNEGCTGLEVRSTHVPLHSFDGSYWPDKITM